MKNESNFIIENFNIGIDVNDIANLIYSDNERNFEKYKDIKKISKKEALKLVDKTLLNYYLKRMNAK